MSFKINESTIGIKGASGEAWITQRMDGSIRDVICHMKIPGHWIFKTESSGGYDLVGYYGAMRPHGKKGSIDLESDMMSPRSITYWSRSEETIGWYGSISMERTMADFQEMGAWLSSTEAETRFNFLYENGRHVDDPINTGGFLYRMEVDGSVSATPLPACAGEGTGLSDEERREKNRKAKERAKARKMAAKTAHVPVGMAYKV